MGVYSMLTDAGLNEITNAQPDVGILIEVNHWVASFDQDLENDYNNTGNTDWKYITNYTSPTDVAPIGDPIYWKSGSSNTPITHPTKDDLWTGVSYVSVVNYDVSVENKQGEWDWLGTDELPQNPGDGDWWEVVVANTVDGIFYDVGNALLWNGTAWQNGVENKGRGKFRVIVSNPNESMTINKIGIYGSRRSVDGIIQDDPFLLGQIIIPAKQLIQPKVVTNDTFAVDQLVVDFEIDIQSIITDFDEIIYASPTDYWDRVVGNDGQYGLATDGQVYITNRLGIEDQTTQFPSVGDVGVGKLLVATYQTVNKFNPHEEELLPQLVLQYVNTDNYDGINGGSGYIGNAFSPRIRTTFRTNPQGNCEIDLYGSCKNDYGYYALIPKEDRLFGLGNDDNRWKTLKLSDRFELYLGAPRTKGEDDFYVNTNTTKFGYMVFERNSKNGLDTGLAYFGNSSVVVGPHKDDFEENIATDNYYYMYGNISNYNSPFISDSKQNDRPYSLNIRSTQDVALYSMSTDYLSSDEFGRGKGDDAETNVGQLWHIAMNGVRKNTKGKFDLTESKFVQNIVQGDSFFKKFYTDYQWIHNTNSGKNLTSIQRLRESIYGNSDAYPGDFSHGEGIRKDFILASSRYIYTHGDIVPMIDRFNNLGGPQQGFRSLYVDTIVGAHHTSNKNHYDYEGWRVLNIAADLIPSGSTTKIRRNPFNGHRFQVIDCDSIGNNVIILIRDLMMMINMVGLILDI